MPKQRRLSRAGRRAYLAGVRRGKALAAAALHRQRVQAGRKGGEETARRKKAPKAPAVTVAVDELVFYDSPDEGFTILSGIPLAEHMAAAEWRADVEMRNVRTGAVLVHETLILTAEPMWDVEPVQATLRREARSWYDGVRGEHPEWFDAGQSPTVDLFRLSLTKR